MKISATAVALILCINITNNMHKNTKSIDKC